MPRTRWVKNLLAKINAKVSEFITFMKNACEISLLFVIPRSVTILWKPRVTQWPWNIKLDLKAEKHAHLNSSARIHSGTCCLHRIAPYHPLTISIYRLNGKKSHCQETETDFHSLMWISNLKSVCGLQQKVHLLISTLIPLSSSMFLDFYFSAILSQSPPNYGISPLSEHPLMLICNMQTRIKAEEFCTEDTVIEEEGRIPHVISTKSPHCHLLGFYMWSDGKVIHWETRFYFPCIPHL